MSESASALFSIADAGEFRFARFYIVCEEMPLGTPESPPIVSGVSGMRPSDCPNVEETRNPMQTFSWKKCSHFSPTNIPSAFPHEILKCVSCNLTYRPKNDMLIAAVPFLWGVPYTGIKKEYKNGLRRMETLTIVESGGLACYHWKMFHITIRSKTGGTDHGCEYDRTVRAGSAGAP